MDRVFIIAGILSIAIGLTVLQAQPVAEKQTGLSASVASLAKATKKTKQFCQNAMEPEDFAIAKDSILTSEWVGKQLPIAKTIADENCLTIAQVKELIEIFSFEGTKLEFAIYAYKHTFDTGKYYQVKELFSFQSSARKLDDYIKSVK